MDHSEKGYFVKGYINDDKNPSWIPIEYMIKNHIAVVKEEVRVKTREECKTSVEGIELQNFFASSSAWKNGKLSLGNKTHIQIPTNGGYKEFSVNLKELQDKGCLISLAGLEEVKVLHEHANCEIKYLARVKSVITGVPLNFKPQGIFIGSDIQEGTRESVWEGISYHSVILQNGNDLQEYLINLKELEENNCLNRSLFAVDWSCENSYGQFVQSRLSGGQLDNKIDKIMNTINAVMQAEYNNINNREMDKIIKNFDKTCAPTKFRDFVKVLADKCKKKNVPVELMLGIMVQESEGRCNALGGNNSEPTRGLFQVLNSTNKDPKAMADEAIGMLLSKYKAVNDNNTPPPLADRSLSVLSKEERLEWVKAAQAYKTGQNAAGRAYDSFRDINSKYNLGLNIDENYDDLMLSFFIERAVKGKLKNNVTKASGYAESVLAYALSWPWPGITGS